MFRIFGKERRTLTSDIPTYIVKWKTYKAGLSDDYPRVRECYQAFTNEDEACAYAKALNDARKLLGMTALNEAYAYEQDVNSV